MQMMRERVQKRREEKKKDLWDQVSAGSSLDGQSDDEKEQVLQPTNVKEKKKKQ